MRLVQTTTNTALVPSLSSVKEHCRIELLEVEYDKDLTEIIQSAMRFVEAETHVTLVKNTFSAIWDCFPARRIKLPAWPVQSVSEVKYLDSDGVSQTYLGFRPSLVQTPAEVLPNIDENWPDTQFDAIDAVTITFEAGYECGKVPMEIQHMLKLLCGHWFRNREAVVTRETTKEIELAFNSLKMVARVNEWEPFLQQ